jgi:MFS family permease
MTGFLSYIPLTNRVGRTRAFTIFHVGAVLSMPIAYLYSTTFSTGLVLFFFAGLFTSGIYSGYTIYFPELFPTPLRATGASFCYNVGRFVAAAGPSALGLLKTKVYHGFAEPMRPAISSDMEFLGWVPALIVTAR